jgi:hypothetical protein
MQEATHQSQIQDTREESACADQNVGRQTVTLGDDFDELSAVCDCHEAYVAGKKVRLPHFHSCLYVEARSRLVPRAVELANAEVVIDCAESGNFNGPPPRSARHMESLVAQAGLLNGA